MDTPACVRRNVGGATRATLDDPVTLLAAVADVTGISPERLRDFVTVVAYLHESVAHLDDWDYITHPAVRDEYERALANVRSRLHNAHPKT